MTARNDASRVDPVPAVDQRPQGAPSRSTPATPLTAPPAVPQPTPAALAALTDTDVEWFTRFMAQGLHDAKAYHDADGSLTGSPEAWTRAVAVATALLAAARHGAGDTAPKPERDYRELSGCSHAMHEACANCSCSECGQRIVRAMAGEQVITLPIAVAFDSLDASRAHPEGPQHG